MRSRVFTILSVVSLLLCVGTCALWMRSYWIYEGFEWDRFSRLAEPTDSPMPYAVYQETLGFYSERGGFVVKHGDVYTWDRGGPNSAFTHTGGWADHLERFGNQHSHDGFYIPAWAPALALAILPSVWLIAARRLGKSMRPDCCPKCGYNLCATPDRCPECGTVPKSAEPIV